MRRTEVTKNVVQNFSKACRWLTLWWPNWTSSVSWTGLRRITKCSSYSNFLKLAATTIVSRPSWSNAPMSCSRVKWEILPCSEILTWSAMSCEKISKRTWNRQTKLVSSESAARPKMIQMRRPSTLCKACRLRLRQLRIESGTSAKWRTKGMKTFSASKTQLAQLRTKLLHSSTIWNSLTMRSATMKSKIDGTSRPSHNSQKPTNMKYAVPRSSKSASLIVKCVFKRDPASLASSSTSCTLLRTRISSKSVNQMAGRPRLTL